MPETLVQIEQKAPRGDWRDPHVEFRKGSICYSAAAKNLGALSLPNPRAWQPMDADWKLPPDWKRIVLDGMKERLKKYRSFRLFMDICVRCGACADKCHFYLGSADPKNMPVVARGADALDLSPLLHLDWPAVWLACRRARAY